MLAAVLFGGFIALTIVLADTRLLGPLSALYGVQHGDKAGHCLLFGGLALLVTLAVFSLKHEAGVPVAVRVALVLSVLIGLEELSQTLIPSRNADIFDLLWGYAGVVAGTLLALWLAPLLRIQSPDQRRV